LAIWVSDYNESSFLVIKKKKKRSIETYAHREVKWKQQNIGSSIYMVIWSMSKCYTSNSSMKCSSISVFNPLIKKNIYICSKKKKNIYIWPMVNHIKQIEKCEF
jgi:hypothetical protein